MNAKPGDIITVRHYSLLNVFKSVITEAGEKSLALKISREHSDAYFSVDDPIVLAFSGSEHFRIFGGRVCGLNSSGETLEVSFDAQEEGAKNRLYERTPVSHYADIRIKDTGKKCQALVKDISFYGILIFLNEDLYRGQQLDVDVFLDRDIMSFKAEVVRKYQGAVHMEYGLKILHRGPVVYNHIKNYVRKSQEEFINAFNRK